MALSNSDIDSINNLMLGAQGVLCSLLNRMSKEMNILACYRESVKPRAMTDENKSPKGVWFSICDEASPTGRFQYIKCEFDYETLDARISVPDCVALEIRDALFDTTIKTFRHCANIVTLSLKTDNQIQYC